MLDDTVDWIVSQVESIGLSTSAFSADEVSGNGYTPLAPLYVGAFQGSADIADELVFNGPENFGPITHLLFRNSSGLWFTREVNGTPESFDENGMLALSSAPISIIFAP